MSAHTPGPWKAGARSVTAPETEDRLALDCRLFGGNRADNRANARLISAAPEMLAALKQIHRMGYEDFGDRLMVEAAIAKATKP